VVRPRARIRAAQIRRPSKRPLGSPLKPLDCERSTEWFAPLAFSKLEECRSTEKALSYVAQQHEEALVASANEAGALPLQKLFYDARDPRWRGVVVSASETHVAGKHPRFLVPLREGLEIEYVTQRLKCGKRGPIWKNYYRVKKNGKVGVYRRVLREESGQGHALEEIIPRALLLPIERCGHSMRNPRVFLDSDAS
jgi:hypothetical protein